VAEDATAHAGTAHVDASHPFAAARREDQTAGTGPDPDTSPFARAWSDLRARGHRITPPPEDDQPLLAALARASGWYGDTIDPAKLGIGQKQALVQGLVLAATRDIDWNAELRHRTEQADAVYVDHGVVRNTKGQSIGAAADAVAARIGQILQAHGYSGTDRAWMAPSLRAALVIDPTLSLQPAPRDIAYGGRTWATLWTGLQVARELALTHVCTGITDLLALGRAAMIDPGHDTAPGNTLPTQALIRMAQAAGAVDLSGLGRTGSMRLSEQLQAYALDHFQAELPLLDALGGLSRAAMAAELLQQAGIDQHRPIEVRSIQLAAAWGPVKIEIPLLFGYYRTEIQDYYLERDALSRKDIERLGSDADGRPVDAERVLSQLPASLLDTFNARFDTYKAAAATYLVQAVQTWLDAMPGLAVDAAGSARISVSNVRLQRYVLKPPPFRTMPRLASTPSHGTLLADMVSKAYIVTMEKDGETARYAFDPATRTARQLPPGVSTQAWAAGHPAALFHDDMPAAPPGKDKQQPSPRETVITVQDIATGPLSEIRTWLEPAIAERIERTRSNAAGETASETLRSWERGLVPFRSTYLAIRAGDVRSAILCGLLDVATFLPALGAGLKTGMTAARAIGSTLDAALGGFRYGGLREGLLVASNRARTFGAPLARQATDAVVAMARNAVIHPLDLISPASMMAHMDAGEIARIGADLASTHPVLATKVGQVAWRVHRGDIADLRWTIPRPPDAHAITETRPANMPLYIEARSAAGATLPLQRYGQRSYTRYNAETLEPVGPLLLPDAEGRLYRSLPAQDLHRHRVCDRDKLAALAREPIRADGTIALNGKTYARLDTDFIEITLDQASSLADRPSWKVVEVPGPLTHAVRARLAYDPETRLWRLADTPQLKGGGNISTLLAERRANRQWQQHTSTMARQFQEIARLFANARYDLPAMPVWLYPESVRAQYPQLAGRSLGDQFIKGTDGRIRRFPGECVTHGSVIPGYVHVIDPSLLEQSGMMADYAQSGGSQVRAGYNFDEIARTASFQVGDHAVASLLPWCGVYPLEGGTYLIPALNMASDAQACEHMLLAQGKTQEQVVVQLRTYDGVRAFAPTRAMDRVFRSLCRRLGAMPLRMPLKGLSHGDGIAQLEQALAHHGPCILGRNGKAVMLDAIETDSKGTWLLIRDPMTCSQIRIPDSKEFWEASHSTLTATPPQAGWPLPQVEAIFLPKRVRLLERVRSLSDQPGPGAEELQFPGRAATPT
jgi:hypothetical protein